MASQQLLPLGALVSQNRTHLCICCLNIVISIDVSFSFRGIIVRFLPRFWSRHPSVLWNRITLGLSKWRLATCPYSSSDVWILSEKHRLRPWKWKCFIRVFQLLAIKHPIKHCQSAFWFSRFLNVCRTPMLTDVFSRHRGLRDTGYLFKRLLVNNKWSLEMLFFLTGQFFKC